MYLYTVWVLCIYRIEVTSFNKFRSYLVQKLVVGYPSGLGHSTLQKVERHIARSGSPSDGKVKSETGSGVDYWPWTLAKALAKDGSLCKCTHMLEVRRSVREWWTPSVYDCDARNRSGSLYLVVWQRTVAFSTSSWLVVS